MPFPDRSSPQSLEAAEKRSLGRCTGREGKSYSVVKAKMGFDSRTFTDQIYEGTGEQKEMRFKERRRK